MNATIETLAARLTGGESLKSVAIKTGCLFIYDNENDELRMIFMPPVGTGSIKLNNLAIRYNSDTDLYDLRAYKLNEKTLDYPMVKETEGITGAMLKATAENITQLCFSRS